MYNIETLIISPNFHGYGERISLEMTKLGRKSVCLSFPQGSQYSLLSLYKILLQILYNNIFFLLINLGYIKLDKVLIIRGDFLNQRQLKIIQFRSSEMYLWLMDPVSRLHGLDLGPYKKVFSFDKRDCEVFKFTYLPLFSSFSRLKNEKEKKLKIKKILFIGSIYGDRLDKIINLSMELSDYEIVVWGGFSIFKIKDYYKTKKILSIYKNIKLRFGVVKLNKLLKLANSYSFVFNSVPEDQFGLNMRFYEAVALNLTQISHNDDNLIKIFEVITSSYEPGRKSHTRISSSYSMLLTNVKDAQTANECAQFILNDIVEN